MGIQKLILGLFSTKIGCDNFVESFQAYYKRHEIKLPGRDPHFYLSQSLLSFYEDTNREKDIDKETLNQTALKKTYQVACVPAPDCARALGILVISRERRKDIESAPHLVEELNILMSPIYNAMSDGALHQIYEKLNPNMDFEYSMSDVEELEAVSKRYRRRKSHSTDENRIFFRRRNTLNAKKESEDKRLRRQSLLFIPGLYFVLIFSAVLSVSIASALIALIYGIGSLIGRLPVGIILALGIGGLLGIFGSLKGIIASIFRKALFVPSIVIDINSIPQLDNLIHDICEKVDTDYPDYVILNATSDFFVMEGAVQTFEGIISGRILCMSYPLLDVLSVSELKSILAHEFAHFSGADTEYSTKVSPIYEGTLATLDSLAKNLDEDGSSFVDIPNIVPIFCLSTYLSKFHEIHMRISHKMEYRADEIASELFGANTFKDALSKVVGHGGVFDSKFPKQILNSIDSGTPYLDYYEHFNSQIPRLSSAINSYLSAALKEDDDLLHTHPCLKKRLSQLPEPQPDHANYQVEKAISLLKDTPKYGQLLTQYYTKQIREAVISNPRIREFL